VQAVTIPVTVKMRAGWNDHEINAPHLARLAEDAGAAAVAVHGRTAAQAYTGISDWALIERVAAGVRIPVLGSGDLIEPADVCGRLSGSNVGAVLVGRGVLRNPWILAQAEDLRHGRPARLVSLAERGRFLLEYIDLLLRERIDEAEGFRHSAVREADQPGDRLRRSRERWVVNKVRALGSWYTKGLDNGSHLRTAINQSESLDALRDVIAAFFFGAAADSGESAA
jgi:tRNA-dihydrouridine synthase